jgi:hypothetical protein
MRRTLLCRRGMRFFKGRESAQGMWGIIPVEEAGFREDW